MTIAAERSICADVSKTAVPSERCLPPEAALTSGAQPHQDATAESAISYRFLGVRRLQSKAGQTNKVAMSTLTTYL